MLQIVRMGRCEPGVCHSRVPGAESIPAIRRVSALTQTNCLPSTLLHHFHHHRRQWRREVLKVSLFPPWLFYPHLFSDSVTVKHKL